MYSTSTYYRIQKKKKTTKYFSKKTCILLTGQRMIDTTVYLESCKILSRKLPNAAEWRRGIRCRGGIVGISLGCPLENVRGAHQGCWENGRAKEPATLGPRAWLRGMKQPLPQTRV